MASRSTIRYAAKSAYQLGLMRGIYESHQCNMLVKHDWDNRRMVVDDNGTLHYVPIAKAWLSL